MNMEEKQKLVSKYIESIEMEKVKGKLVLMCINFRESFIENYEEMAKANIVDMTCLLDVDDKLNFYPANEGSVSNVRDYVEKLKKQCDINYYEQFELAEDGIPINRFNTKKKKEEVVKFYGLLEDDKFSKNKYVGMGVITTEIN